MTQRCPCKRFLNVIPWLCHACLRTWRVRTVPLLPAHRCIPASLQVFTLGASVTRGIGTTDRRYSYASRFFEYINTTFPHRCHPCCASGIVCVLVLQIAVVQHAPAGHSSRAGQKSRTLPQHLRRQAALRLLLALPFLPTMCSVLLPTLPAPLGACRDHAFTNRGIGGTSSAIYSVCAEHMVDEVGSRVCSNACPPVMCMCMCVPEGYVCALSTWWTRRT